MSKNRARALLGMVELCEREKPVEAAVEEHYRVIDEVFLQLVEGKAKIDYEIWKHPKLISTLSASFRSEIDAIGEIEDKYGKFLSSALQKSLFDLEEHLRELISFLPGLSEKDNTVRTAINDSLCNLLSKIAKEISELRDHGVA